MEERGGADCILLVLVSQCRPIFQWHMRVVQTYRGCPRFLPGPAQYRAEQPNNKPHSCFTISLATLGTGEEYGMDNKCDGCL